MKYILQLIALILVAVLSGCAGITKTIYVPQEVKIAVPVACIKEEDIPVEPQYALDIVTITDNIDAKGTAALKEIEQRKDWQRLAKAALKSCASASFK